MSSGDFRGSLSSMPRLSIGLLPLLVALASCSDEPAPAGAPTAPRSQPASEVAAPVPAKTTAAFPHRVFASSAEALDALLRETNPSVLGIGEQHQVQGATPVIPAVERFTDEMVEVLGGRASDLILETWVDNPRCNKKERKVSKDVQKAIARPPETEGVLMRLLRRSRELKMRAHALEMKCEDYGALRANDGEVDYSRLLTLVTHGLRDRINHALEGDDAALVVVYGGALHNDLYPNEGVAQWSYVPSVKLPRPEGYVELDLYVPEYIVGNKVLSNQPWFALIDATAPDNVLLIERGPRSYVLLLRRDRRSSPHQ